MICYDIKKTDRHLSIFILDFCYRFNLPRDYFQMKKIIFPVLFLGILVTVYFLKFHKDDPACRKWVYFKSSNIKVTDLNSAIDVLKFAVVGEKHYKNWPIPEDEEGFLKVYNKVPYETDREVRTKEGKWETKKVWDLLFTLASDSDGNVYKYNDCWIF